MTARKYILAWIVIYFLVSCVMFTGAALAEDVATPTPEGVEVTEIAPVPVEPSAVPTAVETATPPENPQGSITLETLMPYVYGFAAIAFIGLLVIGGLGMILLFKSQPVVKAVAPVIVPPVGDAIVSGYEGFAKLTPAAWDDELAKALRTEWEKWKQELKTELADQITKAASSANHAGIVG